jgi:hypothetical protein
VHFVINKATGEKVYHSRKPFLDLLVKRGTHIYEGQPVEVSEKDAKAFIEEKLKALAEKEAEIDAKIKAISDASLTEDITKPKRGRKAKTDEGTI